MIPTIIKGQSTLSEPLSIGHEVDYLRTGPHAPNVTVRNLGQPVAGSRHSTNCYKSFPLNPEEEEMITTEGPSALPLNCSTFHFTKMPMMNTFP